MTTCTISSQFQHSAPVQIADPDYSRQNWFPVRRDSLRGKSREGSAGTGKTAMNFTTRFPQHSRNASVESTETSNITLRGTPPRSAGQWSAATPNMMIGKSTTSSERLYLDGSGPSLPKLQIHASKPKIPAARTIIIQDDETVRSGVLEDERTKRRQNRMSIIESAHSPPRQGLKEATRSYDINPTPWERQSKAEDFTVQPNITNTSNARSNFIERPMVKKSDHQSPNLSSIIHDPGFIEDMHLPRHLIKRKALPKTVKSTHTTVDGVEPADNGSKTPHPTSRDTSPAKQADHVFPVRQDSRPHARQGQLHQPLLSAPSAPLFASIPEESVRRGASTTVVAPTPVRGPLNQSAMPQTVLPSSIAAAIETALSPVREAEAKRLSFRLSQILPATAPATQSAARSRTPSPTSPSRQHFKAVDESHRQASPIRRQSPTERPNLSSPGRRQSKLDEPVELRLFPNLSRTSSATQRRASMSRGPDDDNSPVYLLRRMSSSRSKRSISSNVSTPQPPSTGTPLGRKVSDLRTLSDSPVIMESAHVSPSFIKPGAPARLVYVHPSHSAKSSLSDVAFPLPPSRNPSVAPDSQHPYHRKAMLSVDASSTAANGDFDGLSTSLSALGARGNHSRSRSDLL